jgi:hypothetical protein
MLRWVPVVVMFLLIVMQSNGRAQDHGEIRTSLQGCLNDAVTAGNFDKARMGERGTLIVRCSDQQARQMYINLAARVSERNVTFPNRDKGTELRFGLSTCHAVRQKADGSPAEEFSCRIAISIGAAVLELF